MIELKKDELVFSFPDVHPSAKLRIGFQRTLRIPDDDRDYPLPPGLGEFPLRHVDDVEGRVPDSWLAHGGVLLPMYQSEALWLNFSPAHDPQRAVEYPFAIKIATGKINAVSGQPWTAGLHRHPRQDYVVAPDQPWLDGYCVEQGIIRQFVAMPLGAGYTAEEQLTGRAEVGGLQILAIPMKRAAFERRFPRRPPEDYSVLFARAEPCLQAVAEMGLAPGGRMKQEIYDDPYAAGDWDVDVGSRCFVHIANSMAWRQITGEQPPTTPFTAVEYARAGLPWFQWYDDQNTALAGSAALARLRSVAALDKEKKGALRPEAPSVSPEPVVRLRRGRARRQVREYAD